MGTAASTANLLDDVEGHAYGKERCARLCWVCWAWQGWVPWCLAPQSPQGWLRCECLAEIPLWAKSLHLVFSGVFWEKLPESHWEFSL